MFYEGDSVRYQGQGRGLIPCGTLEIRPTGGPDATVNHIGDGTGLAYSQTVFAASGNAQFVGRRARGSESTPDVMQTNDVMASFEGRGWSPVGSFTAARASVRIAASETWTATAQGAQINVLTTPNGTVAIATRWVFTNAGNLIANTDNAVDIGATAANRPRSIFVATRVQVEADGAAGVTSGLCLTNQTVGGAPGAATGTIPVNVNGVLRNVHFS